MSQPPKVTTAPESHHGPPVQTGGMPESTADDAHVHRALVIAAHPDDIDFGAAGTVAAWTAAGVTVSYCVATFGDAGGFDPAVPREQIPGIREAEQRAAAAAVGVHEVTFLGYPDGRLVADLDLRRDLAREIRRARPDRVLCPSTRRAWSRLPASHPDHLACGEAALAAVYPDARNPFAFPELAEEGFEAWPAAQTWLMGGPPAEDDAHTSSITHHAVDVTDTYEAKLAALRAHTSQTAHLDDLDAMLRGWMSATARSAGLSAGRLAESFQTLDTA